MILRRLTTKPRGFLRDATLIVALLLFDPHPRFVAIGAVLFALGAILHFWSKSCLDRNWSVTASGPYRFVRHPFYLANLLLDIGICLFSGQWWLPILYVIAFALIYGPTIKKEEAYLRERHGDSYDRYAARVPALLPYRLLAIFGPLDFQRGSMLREKEISRILRVLAIPLYFCIIAALFDQWPIRYTPRMIMLWSAIGVALSLHIVSTIVRRKERQAQNA